MLSNKEIATQLKALATLYPEFTTNDREVIWHREGLKISCVPCRGAIVKVAQKFEKGVPRDIAPKTRRFKNGRSPAVKIQTKPLWSARVYREMAEEDILNAVAYRILPTNPNLG